VVSARTLETAGAVSADLAVLAEPHRLLVLRHLRRGARTAGFLARACDMSPSLASHHLAVLAEAGLITRRQKGPYVCYTADRDRVRDLHRRLGQLSGALGPAPAPYADDLC